MGRTLSFEELVDKHVYKALDSCWYWLGYIDPDGYGCVGHKGKTVLAHRLMYEAMVGSIPDGLTLDHLCRTTACCNPTHLEPVTQDEQARRSAVARTHCKWGHEFTPENTYRRYPNGKRWCNQCRRKRQRKLS